MKTVIDFYADWCGPCNAMKPALEKVMSELSGKIQLKKVNVDENQVEAAQYGIMSIPTLVVLDDDGKEIDRRMGAMGEAQLKSWLESHTN